MNFPSWRVAFVAAIFVFGIVVRLVALDRLPGINGDEAWYGVNVNELIAGGTPFLQTPSGNFVNPVHSFPLLLLSLVAEPSFVVLRAPEVCWGILTMLLAYPLLARPLGRRVAALTAMLVAVSPTAVVYARFGWDPSGAPLVSLLAIGFALRDQPVLAVVSAAIAYAVHPTTIFMLPMVIAAWIPHARDRWARVTGAVRWRLVIGAACIAALALPVVSVLATSIERMGRLPSVDMIMPRITSVQSWLDSALAIVRLLSGVTSATYIAGPMHPALAGVADLVSLLILAATAGIAVWSVTTRRQWVGLWPTIGLLGSFVMMHVVAGPVALEPGLERYATSLAVPLAIVSALTIDFLAGATGATTGTTGTTRLPTVARSATVGATGATGAETGAIGVAAGSALIGYSVAVILLGYFYPLITRGGDAHQTFRTSRVEPKAAAFEFVRADSVDADVVAVFAEDWWLYWPVRYLALPHRDRMFVELIGHTPPIYPPGVSPPSYPKLPDKVYVIVFDQSPAWRRVRDREREVFTAFDSIRRPILHVVELSPADLISIIDRLPWADKQ